MPPFIPQILVEKLRTLDSDFASSLSINVCVRVLQRRGVVSRLSRFLRKRDATTNLDIWLQEVKDTVLARGQESLLNSFAAVGDMKGEITSFLNFYQKSPSRPRSETGDRFEDLRDRDEDESVDVEDSSPDSLIELHKSGVKAFPEELYEVMAVLQPTSVPAERSFSRARHARRYNQAGRSDRRFEEYLLLKSYYSREKPWSNYLKGEDLQSDEESDGTESDWA